jgi:hypothetical protein
MKADPMPSRFVPFMAIILTALALVPGGAHLLALPNKIGLPQADYFIVQGIYRGWALLGAVLIGAMIANVVFAVQLRRAGGAFKLAGAVLIAATLAIFFIWTFPGNQATANWTVAPADWEALRGRWEYSHAVNAVLTFLALCAVTAAALRASGAPPVTPD